MLVNSLGRHKIISFLDGNADNKYLWLKEDISENDF
jgi:hypothetical protein